ncbi:hypothetical protein QYF61_000681 [Mycteria americana]|uniref:Uncharacterized protein n=1 Tax=Mycteria americana TaxID=33587 RepID=A0AAN7P1J6_MYCAM|nr:hypothetical protein QYF61_000681 [Mycteria americana]
MAICCRSPCRPYLPSVCERTSPLEEAGHSPCSGPQEPWKGGHHLELRVENRRGLQLQLDKLWYGEEAAGVLVAHIVSPKPEREKEKRQPLKQSEKRFFCELRERAEGQAHLWGDKKEEKKLVGHQRILVHGIVPPQVQNLHFPLSNFARFLPAHFFGLMRSLWMEAQPSGVSATPSQFCVISKLAETTLRLIIQIMNEAWIIEKKYLRNDQNLDSEEFNINEKKAEQYAATRRAEQPQLSQPFLIGEVFHPSDHFHGPPLDLLQQLHVFPVLRTPELDAVLQVESHQGRVEGQNRLPRPAGHASFDAAQDTVGFLGCRCTFPSHVQLLIQQYPQVLLHRAALNPFIPQPVFVLGIAPTHVQDFALGLVEPREVHMGPLLELVPVLLDGIPSLRHVNRTTQLGVVCRLAEGAFDPTMSLMKILNRLVPVQTPEGHHLSLISIRTLSC